MQVAQKGQKKTETGSFDALTFKFARSRPEIIFNKTQFNLNQVKLEPG